MPGAGCGRSRCGFQSKGGGGEFGCRVFDCGVLLLYGCVTLSFPNDVREVTIGEKGILAGLHVGVDSHDKA